MATINTSPEEFIKFDTKLRLIPGYTPFYLKLKKNSKDPYATEKNFSWKARALTTDEAIEALKEGYGVGIAAMEDDPLVIIDVDNIELTQDHEYGNTLSAVSGGRLGKHYFYFTNDKAAKIIVPAGKAGEIRSNSSYVVAPGSYCTVTGKSDSFGNILETGPERIARIPEEDRENAGKYEIIKDANLSEITYNGFPEIFKTVYEAGRKADEESAQRKLERSKKEVNHGAKHAALFDIELSDVISHLPDKSRFPSIFHGSNTGQNTQLSSDDNLMHCWRCNVSINGLQALAVKEGLYTCAQAGKAHKNSGAGASQVNLQDAETVYRLWIAAKRDKILPPDDPIPSASVIKWCAISRGYCTEADLIDGWKVPLNAYLKVIKDEGLFIEKPKIEPKSKEKGNPPDIDIKQISKMNAPAGYKITKKGIEKPEIRINKETKEEFTVDVVVCDTPIWITSKMVDHTHNTVYINIEFIDVFGKISSIRRPLQSVLTKKGVLELIDVGIITTDAKAPALVEYFREILSSLDIPVGQIYDCFGWNHNGYVIGNKIITRNGTQKTHISDTVNQSIIEAVGTKGTLEGWIKTVDPLLKYSNVRFEMYVGCTAPLLKILSSASFFSEMCSRTSTGKTTISKVVMSMMGNPKKLLLATDVTPTFMEIYCTVFNDMIIALDDTTLMDQKVIDKLVYTLTNEVGRGRGKKDGGVRETNRWKSICLTSGELSVLSGRHMGGAEVRTIQVSGGIPEHIPQILENYDMEYLNNYGHIIELIIKKIYELEDEIPKYYALSVDYFKKIVQADTKIGTTTRLISTYAAITTAGMLLESIFDDIGIETMNPLNIVQLKLNEKLNETVGKISDRAYDVVMDWKITNRGNFNKDKVPYTKVQIKCYGNITTDISGNETSIEIVPTELEFLLDRHFDRPGIHKAILKEWFDDGTLLTTDKRMKKRLVIQNTEKSTEVYQIKIKGGA